MKLSGISLFEVRIDTIRVAIASAVVAILIAALSMQPAGAVSLTPGVGAGSSEPVDELTRVFTAAPNPLSTDQIIFLEKNVVLPGYGSNPPIDNYRHHPQSDAPGLTAY